MVRFSPSPSTVDDDDDDEDDESLAILFQTPA
jgi:hypothetical protein